MTTDTLAKLAAPADFVTRLLAVVQIYQQQDDTGTADANELYRAVCRVVGTAQALPAAEPVAPKRADFVRVARIFAEAYGLHEDAPGYLPRSPDAVKAFEPHGWVIAAMMQAYADGKAAQQAAQAPAGWQPIETAEEGLLYVVSWVDPDDGLERHDFDHLEDGVWQQHADSVEHFQMCAPPGSRGPKERPPYTHCLKLAALPQPQPQSAQAKGDAA